MIQKITTNITIPDKLTSFTVCGDPGCDGYNTEAIKVFEHILKLKADMLLIVGDVVPVGTQQYFEQFINIVNAGVDKPVYCLPGNHDIKMYETFLGKKDYYIKYTNALFVVLDNSKRYFTDETITFLQKTLQDNPSDNIFISFHIPPPNPFILNNISDEEWDKIKTVITDYKTAVKMIFCGHVHSAFEYYLDGYKIIVTGGAGAQLDPVKNTCLKNNEYHAFTITHKNGTWTPEIININPLSIEAWPDKTDISTNRVYNDLNEAFAGEAQAHRKYLLFSLSAEKQGLPGIAKLFKAAAESEFIHAKNMAIAADMIRNTKADLQAALSREKEEIEKLYPDFIDRAVHTLVTKCADNAFSTALTAEKIHHKLFSRALDALQAGNDIPVDTYHTCARCGYTHHGDKPPARCPGCGTDMFKFTEVQ